MFCFCKHFILFMKDLIERKRWWAISSNLLGHLPLAVFCGYVQHDLCGQSILVVLEWILVCFILPYSVTLRQVFYLGLFYFTTRASTTSGRSRTGMGQWYYVQLTRGVGSAWSGLALLRSSCPVSLPRCRIQARGLPNGSSLFLW
jgi:hypothetical protein